jgi:hypothetical protein
MRGSPRLTLTRLQQADSRHRCKAPAPMSIEFHVNRLPDMFISRKSFSFAHYCGSFKNVGDPVVISCMIYVRNVNLMKAEIMRLK